ncbi:energy transducer TonB [Sphingomonas colocasiae]|uniref:Energy transducer TonB n=1 Tax=Sphingomonas colocasiae TaxID=1848973 RepID=A0ABS7PQH3_9SPHN|nr:energy transducer TonB [Sphingomonas colocasiae]MBY8823441.1 energy transducer TonB [Sphingomonas colocasiae]
MTTARRLGVSSVRGLRRIERTDGATLYHVVFGERRRARKRAKLSFDDDELEDVDRRQLSWRGWTAVIGIHAILVLTPLIHYNRATPPEGDTREGMTVDLVVEPGQAPRDAVRARPVAGADAEDATRDAPRLPRVVDAPEKQAAAGSASAPAPSIAPVPSPDISHATRVDARAAPLATAPSIAGARAISTEEERWEGEILGRIAAKKRYPRAALSSGAEDVITLRLVIDRKGALLHAELLRSRGHAELDREVLALAKRAAPYPKPPDSVPGENFSMLVPVEFVIRRR